MTDLPPTLDPLGHDLLRLFAAPGCPICAAVEQAVQRGLTAIADESITDPDARGELRQALGFCAVHGQQWLGFGNALATAILYHDLCGHLQHILAQSAAATGAGQSRTSWRPNQRSAQQLARDLTPTRACPACEQTRSTEDHAVQACAAGLTHAAFRAAFVAHPLGLCLPHLRAVLPLLRDAAVLRVVVQAQADRYAATRAHLAEVIRKYDYRFVHEPKGDEFAAVRRSVELVAGQLPTQINPPGK
ncbi:MAG: DUF6062 family protein [Chloroflexota bacterium]|nr:DUF6062 family protein [Chloroflexota bacterium]